MACSLKSLRIRIRTGDWCAIRERMTSLEINEYYIMIGDHMKPAISICELLGITNTTKENH